MNDFVSVIKELEKKRQEVQDTYKAECKRLEVEYVNKVLEINKAIKIITEMNDVCLECEGKGYTKEYTDAHDDRGYNKTCKYCNGTGYRINIKENTK